VGTGDQLPIVLLVMETRTVDQIPDVGCEPTMFEKRYAQKSAALHTCEYARIRLRVMKLGCPSFQTITF